MTLADIAEKIEPPFDIPVLLHPQVDHFMIALPVIILLVEIINLIMKKKAIGGISFFLILFMVTAAIGAYLTGIADGKEAFPELTDVAKTALSEHKQFGIYLLFASVVLLFFKLLASITGNVILKSTYLFILIIFVVGIFKQGQEGGELVYKHGINVERVKTLDDELFDQNERIEELTEKVKDIESTIIPEEVESAPVTSPASIETPEEITPVETLNTEIKDDAVVPPPVQQTVKPIEVEAMPEEMIQPQIPMH